MLSEPGAGGQSRALDLVLLAQQLTGRELNLPTKRNQLTATALDNWTSASPSECPSPPKGRPSKAPQGKAAGLCFFHSGPIGNMGFRWAVAQEPGSSGMVAA